jgi:hypothetical protein
MLEEQAGHFDEASLRATPIRDLGLRIEGTRLEPIIASLLAELQARQVDGVTPRFYLSTEWGVAFGTIAIAIPFYLARPELEALHEEREGHVEGFDAADVLRYLRHEMGHVVSYGHRLHALEEWIRCFGAMTRPYIEEYKPLPFDRRFVRHLPGWYAQKHPDEDWAETFAVWLTPGLDWRREYADHPDALAKLQLCDRLMAEYGQRAAAVQDDSRDEDVSELYESLDAYYSARKMEGELLPQTLDSALQTIFAAASPSETSLPASELLLHLELPLLANVFRWTGHFPERTRHLIRHLAARADALSLRYQEEDAQPLTVAISTFTAALAMNHVHKGSYTP